MVTADQLVAHAVGDYLLQSDWMANEKTKRSVAALAHVATYVLPFLFLTRSIPVLAVIGGTHFVIDRWRLARYVVWAKERLAPPSTTSSWAESSATGYSPAKPAWMAVWLMIVADNVLHVLINAAAIRWIG